MQQRRYGGGTQEDRDLVHEHILSSVYVMLYCARATADRDCRSTMQMLDFVRRRFLLAVFVVSGFTGLIYESIWSHYLKLFLGHAAYAQTLDAVLLHKDPELESLAEELELEALPYKIRVN